MSRFSCLARNGFQFSTAVLLVAGVFAPSLAQQSTTYRGSVVTDWTSRHVLFSDAGTLTNAMKSRSDRWERIVNDPRYQMQQIRRDAPSARLTTISDFHSTKPSRNKPSPPQPQKSKIHQDWSVPIASTGFGVADWAYPAKYSFDPSASPSCGSDYVVYPVWENGASTQANIVGVNNLYSGTCAGTVPSVLFAYEVGTGQVYNSPTLSLDGTKIAFVESISGGSKFHVLTIDQSGNAGCATDTSPCNGASYNAPAVPGVNNSAVDVAITMDGGVSDTFSSPFIDYTHDIAYVGDDNGTLHKFTGVFHGTPTEVTTNGWPMTIASGSMLTSPTYDSGSQDIFLATQYPGGGAAATTGTLYCVNAAAATASFCSTSSIAVGTNIFDGPIVDSTWEQVFVTADDSTDTNMILFQTPVNFGSSVTVDYGAAGTNHYIGAFDNAYYSSVSTGHLYACGNQESAATPVLFRIGFNSSGVMNGSPDSGSFALVKSGESGAGVSCTALTEFYNVDQSTDYLFLGVEYYGFESGNPNCGGIACMMSFTLPTTSPFTFPSGPTATLTENYGYAFSSIVVDNYSNESGASQVYFGNIGEGAGIQASQAALQ